MPIAFPLKPMGRPGIWAKNVVSPSFVPFPNLGNPGFAFTMETMGMGRGKIYPSCNPAGLGINIGKRWAIANLETRQLKDAKVTKNIKGNLLTTLSGVSRDATGAILGSCQVMVFQSLYPNAMVAETVSDGSGVWSVSFIASGPFFLVEYKVGSPDVFGTSRNTLIPSA